MVAHVPITACPSSPWPRSRVHYNQFVGRAVAPVGLHEERPPWRKAVDNQHDEAHSQRGSATRGRSHL
eukprot:3551428-Prymnesium_polylepis.2